MRFRILNLALLGLMTALVGVLCAQMPFRQFPGAEHDPEEVRLPEDYQEKTEWVFGRLMYSAVSLGFRRGGESWTIDYPVSDRHLARGVRRLTRIHARSVEQPISLKEGDDVYNWPWLYGVEVGHWELSEDEAKKMRDYLLRGGFFMCDDFHGVEEWDIFIESMKKVFPDRPVVDIPNDDPIFHVLYDLDDRYQVPGAQYLYTGSTSEKGGTEAHWRGIYDDKGRLMVVICHNMDLGDSWEWSDDPRYSEKWAALGYRIGVNYIVYSMTH